MFSLEEFRELKSQAQRLVREFSPVAEREGQDLSFVNLQSKKLQDEEFYIVVVGEFSSGKSTLLNALMGSKILPASTRPTTATLNEIRHSESPRVRVHYRDDRPYTDIDRDELKAFVTVKGGKATSEVNHVELRESLPFLGEGVCIVDTPGVNDPDEHREKLTCGYLPRADAVVFVILAKRAGTESQRRFLSDDIRPEKLSSVFVVLNQIDLVRSEEDRNKIEEHTRSVLFPESCGGRAGKFRILRTSAKMALNALNEDDGDRMEKSGVPELRREIEDLITRNKGRGLLFGLTRELRAAGESLQAQLEADDRTLKMNLREQKEAFERLKAEGDRLEGILERVCGNVERDIDSLRAEIYSNFQREKSRAGAKFNHLVNALNSHRDDPDRARREFGSQLRRIANSIVDKEQHVKAEVSRIVFEARRELDGHLQKASLRVGGIQDESGSSASQGYDDSDLDVNVDAFMLPVASDEFNVGAAAIGAGIGFLFFGKMGAAIGGMIGGALGGVGESEEDARKRQQDQVAEQLEQVVDRRMSQISLMLDHQSEGLRRQLRRTRDEVLDHLESRLRSARELRRGKELEVQKRQADLHESLRGINRVLSGVSRIECQIPE